jgi:hypothetical protein
MFRRWTPRKVMMNPQRSDKVPAASVVLKPWKRMREATTVAVEKPT